MKLTESQQRDFEALQNTQVHRYFEQALEECRDTLEGLPDNDSFRLIQGRAAAYRAVLTFITGKQGHQSARSTPCPPL